MVGFSMFVSLDDNTGFLRHVTNIENVFQTRFEFAKKLLRSFCTDSTNRVLVVAHLCLSRTVAQQ